MTPEDKQWFHSHYGYGREKRTLEEIRTFRVQDWGEPWELRGKPGRCDCCREEVSLGLCCEYENGDLSIWCEPCAQHSDQGMRLNVLPVRFGETGYELISVILFHLAPCFGAYDNLRVARVGNKSEIAYYKYCLRRRCGKAYDAFHTIGSQEFALGFDYGN
jgi:hypothetical protein